LIARVDKADTSLPQQLEHFHSLVALDTNTQKSASAYGYPSWIYKAVSSKDGYTYALRRLEGGGAKGWIFVSQKLT